MEVWRRVDEERLDRGLGLKYVERERALNTGQTSLYQLVVERSQTAQTLARWSVGKWCGGRHKAETAQAVRGSVHALPQPRLLVRQLCWIWGWARLEGDHEGNKQEGHDVRSDALDVREHAMGRTDCSQAQFRTSGASRMASGSCVLRFLRIR